MAGPDGQYPVIGHDHIISCIPPLIINPNSMVVAHVILVTALVQNIGLGILDFVLMLVNWQVCQNIIVVVVSPRHS